MHLIGTIIIGFIVGAIAKLLHPGKDPGGWVISIILGLAGSFVAEWIGRSLGWYGPQEPAGFILSVVGAVLLLFLYRVISKKKA
ncbi:MAG: GlsB/YeaQ/YmgE family stress response membrane protein [Verrucomicrobiota bacterium]